MHGLESPFVLSCGETDFYRMGFKMLRIGSLKLSFAPALLWALPVQSWGCDDAQVSDWPRCHFPPCNPKSSRFTSLHLTAVRASLYLNLGGDADGVLDKEIKKETIYTDPQGLGFSGSYFVLGGWGGWDDDVPCMCTHVRCYTTVASLLHTCSMLRNWWSQSPGPWPKLLQVHTSAVENIKDWVPNYLSAQSSGKLNDTLMAYCRQWQWRNADKMRKDLMASHSHHR